MSSSQVLSVFANRFSLIKTKHNSYHRLVAKFLEYSSYLHLSQLEKIKLSENFGFKDVIAPSILIKYQVRVSKDLNQIVFPWYHDLGDYRTSSNQDHAKIIGYRVHTRNEETGTIEVTQENFYDEDHLGFFGIHKARNNSIQTVIVSNEFEALAVANHTKFQAVALPMTESYLRQATSDFLPDQFVPLLERFQKLIVWISVYSIGNLNNMRRLAHEIARELGTQRTQLVSYNPRDSATLAPSYVSYRHLYLISGGKIFNLLGYKKL